MTTTGIAIFDCISIWFRNSVYGWVSFFFIESTDHEYCKADEKNHMLSKGNHIFIICSTRYEYYRGRYYHSLVIPFHILHNMYNLYTYIVVIFITPKITIQQTVTYIHCTAQQCNELQWMRISAFISSFMSLGFRVVARGGGFTWILKPNALNCSNSPEHAPSIDLIY